MQVFVGKMSVLDFLSLTLANRSLLLPVYEHLSSYAKSILVYILFPNPYLNFQPQFINKKYYFKQHPHSDLIILCGGIFGFNFPAFNFFRVVFGETESIHVPPILMYDLILWVCTLIVAIKFKKFYDDNKILLYSFFWVLSIFSPPNRLLLP